MSNTRATLVWQEIPGLDPSSFTETHSCQTKCWFGGVSNRRRCNFACISVEEEREVKNFSPTSAQLLKDPMALIALVPKDAALFAAGAIAGAAAKTVTAPLDRVKLLMQTHGLRAGQDGAKKGIGFIEARIYFFSKNRKAILSQFVHPVMAKYIRLTTFDAVKRLIAAAEKEFQDIVKQNRKKQPQSGSNSSI
ncbi:hypothetical protein CDL12_10162 [Handroanthus impetiginosus]|uniref:Mitochondrial carrier protein n=1 Tax=Handroanthus impetiginosus TaxID=429701 RepID=A0A2G9HIR0_9LAMI|nr:hypothetical protein CDL12_10162 [Handroanthus impetiginosus]